MRPTMSKSKNKGKDKNKDKKGLTTPKEPVTASVLDSIFGKAKEVIANAPKITEVVNSATETIKGSLTNLSSVENKLTDEQKNEFKDLLEKLKETISAYKTAQKDTENSKIEYENLLKSLDDRDEKLMVAEDKLEENIEKNKVEAEKLKTQKQEQDLLHKNTQKELDERKQSLDNRETSLNERDKKIAQRESDIHRREVEADAGFKANELKWKKEATDKFEKDIKQIKDSLEQQELKINEKIAQLKKDQAKCCLEQQQCDAQKEAFKEAKESLKFDYDNEIARLRDDFENRIEIISTEKKNLQNQIAQFNDIRAELDGRSAKEIKDLINSLQEEKKDLKRQLQTIGSEEYQQNLEEELEHYKDLYENAIAEKNAQHTQLLQLRNAIVDRDGLRAINKTLTTHNKALEEYQKQLQNELNELTSKNENKEIFAEFKSIDKTCNLPYNRFANSDSASLNDFVNALGYQLTQYTPNLYYTPQTLQLFVGGLAMSRLIILQGISGTGKTKLAQAFASIVGDHSNGSEQNLKTERCSCIVPVQAGWRDNQDLLGYYNAFEKKFYEKPFSKGLYAASTPMFKDRLFFIILDEMNLSHPEQYFADFISAMEQANSVSDPFEVDLLSGIPNTTMESDNWPKYLNKEKIIVPPNVWFIGTANHDETTMEFADKTYDRAHVMVMERNEAHINYPRATLSAHWSATALRNAFKSAQISDDGKQKSRWVKEKLNSLRDTLKNEFDVSFGNRLERQIDDFVPVVCAAGGSKELALDHLIATKIVRKGKITGLFGVQQESLEILRDQILRDLQLNEQSQTIRLLNQDIAAKERGA